VKRTGQDASRVAYFTGCSAGYLFPAAAKAAVGLLEQHGIQVFVPSQHCCGMGGHLGFKTDFHDHSLAIGGPLFDRMAAASGRTIITDCLSCRMQLQHQFSRQVFHPLELLISV